MLLSDPSPQGEIHLTTTVKATVLCGLLFATIATVHAQQPSRAPTRGDQCCPSLKETFKENPPRETPAQSIERWRRENPEGAWQLDQFKADHAREWATEDRLRAIESRLTGLEESLGVLRMELERARGFR